MPKPHLDDEEHDDGRDQAEADYGDEEGHHDRKKKKKKVKIMTNSGQTEADRRLLRRKQRELHQEIAVGSAETSGGMEDPNSGEFERMRGKNNELFEEVRYTREAVLDSENMDLITAKAARQVERIVQVPRYDAIRLAQNLAKKASIRTPSGISYFEWKDMGFQVGVCFNSLPTNVSFLYGPLDASYQPKERKKPERKARQSAQEEDDEEEEQPDDLDQTKKKESDGNELSAVEAHMKVIFATLKDRFKEERESAVARKQEYIERISQEVEDEKTLEKMEKKYVKETGKVDAVKYLFNPSSFTQTVENIFHFSFLVKNGKAGINVRSAEEAQEFGVPPGPVAVPKEDVGGGIHVPTQAIVSLNMKDWRDMCQAYTVNESDVPNRKSPKKRARNP